MHACVHVCMLACLLVNHGYIDSCSQSQSQFWTYHTFINCDRKNLLQCHYNVTVSQANVCNSYIHSSADKPPRLKKRRRRRRERREQIALSLFLTVISNRIHTIHNWTLHNVRLISSIFNSFFEDDMNFSKLSKSNPNPYRIRLI